jgi:hypothetical protein
MILQPATRIYSITVTIFILTGVFKEVLGVINANKIVYNSEGRNNLGLDQEAVLLRNNKNFVSLLEDPKNTLNHILKLGMSIVE